MPKVSIIVPIHNAGKNLSACLNTLVNQTLFDIEIICVLDKPTDESEKIVKFFAEKDNRIKLIYNKNNLHIAESRNRGLSVASGEYIGFSDHDDIRSLDMYIDLYSSTLFDHPDIVFSDSVIDYGIKKECVKYNDPTKEGIIRSIILPINHSLNKNRLSRSVWASIYRRKFLLNNNIVFLDRRKYVEEDTLFNLKAFSASNSIFYVNKAYYCWNRTVDSLSSSCNAVSMVNYFCHLTDTLIEFNYLSIYKNDVNRMISADVYSHHEQYSKMKIVDINQFVKVLRKTQFPIFGMYENLRFISRKRIKLTKIILDLYMKYYFSRFKCHY